jgi:uncharacterized protein YbjT (DUF2867 family)
MSKKIITVFGGTGVQGSAVVRALVAPERAGKYHVRVGARDPSKEKGKAVGALKDVEFVQASYDDYASLVKAMSGAYGAWFITSFWEKMDPKVEIGQGASVAKAAKEVGLQHLVFSSLETPKKYGADFDLAPFDDKVAIEEEIKKVGVPYTFVNVACYLNNFETFSMPKKYDPNGPYVIALPIGPHGMHLINNTDVGPLFAHVFDHPEEFKGKKIGVSGFLCKNTQEIADAFNEVFAPAKFVAASDFDAFKAAVAPNLVPWMMYKGYDLSKGEGFDYQLLRKVYPGTVTSVKAYLIANKDKFKF